MIPPSDRSSNPVSTSYPDILQIHRFDPLVTLEETTKALHDQVESNKGETVIIGRPCAHAAVTTTRSSQIKVAHVTPVARRPSILVCEMRLRGEGDDFVEAGVTHYI
ncbi:hypothetical protein K503DRAFT_787401 [Rhizopogon vinicolor AM-OR11-026]|uniref:NADP-dependent oxidoreductase domain-containing protein n=1 Tax=Rhizopogon vinicolor AM-OR11-026 TaxID=1314800 RepID=A0A1B7MHQ2_9AGAM|nr:hypothetical protein K503DRAFT_787401 [Rhizopogon vinicolor AM-OR11-026]